MKIHISTRGDRSVGLQGGYVQVEGLPAPDDAEEREVTRTMLKEVFSELMGEPAMVSFQDEVDAETKMMEEQ